MKANLIKRIYYKLFKPEVFLAAVAFQGKLKARLKRINTAIQKLNKWSDIPFTYQNSSIARVLGFPEDSNVTGLMRAMVVHHNHPDLMKTLIDKTPLTPSIPYHTSKEVEKAIRELRTEQHPHFNYTLPEEKKERFLKLLRFSHEWTKRDKKFAESLLPMEHYWNKFVLQ
jgi:hypothetical protein